MARAEGLSRVETLWPLGPASAPPACHLHSAGGPWALRERPTGPVAGLQIEQEPRTTDLHRAQSEALENVAERTAKPRQQVLAVQLAVRLHGRDRSVRPVDARIPALLVEDPHDPHARAQPLTYLLQHLAGPVVGRDDLRYQVGRELGVTFVWDVREPLARHEGDVRRSTVSGSRSILKPVS